MAKAHYSDTPSEQEKKSFAKFLAEDEELIVATGYGAVYLRSFFITNIAWPGGILIAMGAGAAYLFAQSLLYGVLIGLVGACILAFLRTKHTYHANRYLLTTRRVIIKEGLFAVKITTALYDKITHIEVDQGFMDKLLYHHGTIIINTAGMNKVEMTLKYVDYPIELKNLLERLINREREQYGGRTSSVTTIEGEIVE